MKKPRGRPPTPRKRLGHKEKALVERLLRKVRRFPIAKADAPRRETSLNSRLIADLRSVDNRISNVGIASVKFIGQTYRPECTIKTTAPYALFSLECKKLHDHSAKRLFKEGLAQSSLYLTKSKVVVLCLYDFTSNYDYAKAFGRGNTDSSRFASRARDELGLHIICES